MKMRDKKRAMVCLAITLAFLLTGAATSCFAEGTSGNLIKNPGFEDGLSDWTPYHSSGQASETIETAGCYTGKCLKMQNSSASSQYVKQIITPPQGDVYYVVSVMFKTTSGHAAYIYFIDLNWKNSAGVKIGKGFVSREAYGNNEWERIIVIFKAPTVDDSGESVAGHSWALYLYGHKPTDNHDPVYYDEIELVPKTDFLNEFLRPYGCSNNGNSECLDFGSSNESQWYNTDAADIASTEGEISFRAIKPGNTLAVSFPAFNTEGDLGLPKTPMLLEIRYKDTIDETIGSSEARTSSVAFVDSYINYVCEGDVDCSEIRKDKVDYTIAHLGQNADNTWKTMQYAFQKSQFQLIRAINGAFKIKIRMPAGGATPLPIDYISLRAITQEEYETFSDKQRTLRGFYEVEMPADQPPQLPAYNPWAEVFVRDIMMPVYKHTKPSQEEIDKAASGIESFSALGEIEPLAFGIYSSSGINGLTVSISDLVNSAGGIINKNEISVQKVVYDEKRLSPYYGSSTFAKAYALVPDRLEDFSSISIEPGTSQRIWLKVSAPENISGGLYQGEIQITGNSVSKTIPVKLNIIPIKLDYSEHLNTVLYGEVYERTISKDLEEVYKIYVDSGFDPFLRLRQNPVVDNGNGIEFNTHVYDEEFLRMRDEGFLRESREAMVSISTAVGYIASELGLHTWDNYDMYTALNNSEFRDAFGRLIVELGNYEDYLLENYGIDVSFYYFTNDEPGAEPDRRIYAYMLNDIIQSNGGKTTMTYAIQCDTEISKGAYTYSKDTIDALTNVIDYKMWNPTHQGTSLTDSHYGIYAGCDPSGNCAGGYSRHFESAISPDYYGEYGYYTTTMSYLRDPIYNRLEHGLLPFSTDTKIVGAYAMASMTNDPFNDFDAKGEYIFPFTYPDFIFAYPTWSGKLIYAMNLEGIREGIKDGKYIATLKRLIRENQGTQTATEASNYLDSLKQRVNPDYWNEYPAKTTQYGYQQAILADISETANPTDFEAFTKIRKKIVDYIVKLNNFCNNNGTCETGETFETCPQDCPQECIREPELLGYISQWKRGEISMLTLMQKMRQWKTGTGC